MSVGHLRPNIRHRTQIRQNAKFTFTSHAVAVNFHWPPVEKISERSSVQSFQACLSLVRKATGIFENDSKSPAPASATLCSSFRLFAILIVGSIATFAVHLLTKNVVPRRQHQYDHMPKSRIKTRCSPWKVTYSTRRCEYLMSPPIRYLGSYVLLG